MSNSYQQRYQAIKNEYDLIQTIDLTAALARLDSAIQQYSSNQSSANQNALDAAFLPIAQYSNSLNQVSSKTQRLLNDAGQSVMDSTQRLTSEERYTERQHPETTIKAREVSKGIFQTLHPKSLPYLMAAGSFMAILSIFMIFQLFGLRLGLPPAFTDMFRSEPGALPFYKNPMILGGIVAVLLISSVVFGTLYYQSWKQQQNK